MSKKQMGLGLGRGLNALLGDPEIHPSEEGTVTLPISQVEPGLNQPRKCFEADALDELAQSIRNHGIIQPLIVRRLSTGYYQIIAGERRWRAAKAAGLTEVPVIIMEADDRKVMELGLIENLQREDLNPAEEAHGFQTLMEEYGLTQEQLAQRIGKSRPAVANTLRLLSLPSALMTMLEDKQLSAGHARALLPLPSPELQCKAAEQVVHQQLSVRQTETLVKTWMKDSSTSVKQSKNALSDDWKLALNTLEKDLSGSLGRKVKIAHHGQKGKIELEYYNVDDLEALLQALKQLGETEAELFA